MASSAEMVVDEQLGSNLETKRGMKLFDFDMDVLSKEFIKAASGAPLVGGGAAELPLVAAKPLRAALKVLYPSSHPTPATLLFPSSSSSPSSPPSSLVDSGPFKHYTNRDIRVHIGKMCDMAKTLSVADTTTRLSSREWPSQPCPEPGCRTTAGRC
jgi:hypothetical protein